MHEAARICSAGHGGQVLVSDEVRQALGSGWAFRDLGQFRLEDFDVPHGIHQLVARGLAAEFPPLRAVEEVGRRLT